MKKILLLLAMMLTMVGCGQKDNTQEQPEEKKVIIPPGMPIAPIPESMTETQLPVNVRRLRLEHYNQEWLDFIVSSRRGEEPWKGYDIIEGGVANDQVIDTVEDYYSGRITAEQAIGQLRFAKPTHQMCISRQPIVDNCLRFVVAEPLEKGAQQ